MPTQSIAAPGIQLIPALANINIGEKDQALIVEAFHNFDIEAAEWAAKAAKLNVTDESQVEEMKMAGDARKALVKVRTSVTALKDKLKRESIDYGKAVQLVHNHIVEKVKAIEAPLKAQEDFAKNRAAERVNATRIERDALVADLLEFMPEGDLGVMSPVIFSAVLAQAKEQRAAQIEAQAKAEAERIALEEAERLERVRIREENERLRAEAEAKEAALAVERAQVEADRAELERKVQIERDAVEAQRVEAERKAQLERDAIESERKRIADKLREKDRIEAERVAAAAKVEAERVAKEEAEAAAKMEAERKAQAAPDKAKLRAYVVTYATVCADAPEIIDPELSAILLKLEADINAVLKPVLSQIDAL